MATIAETLSESFEDTALLCGKYLPEIEPKELPMDPKSFSGPIAREELETLMLVLSSYWEILRPLLDLNELALIAHHERTFERLLLSCDSFYEQTRGFADDVLYLFSDVANIIMVSNRDEEEKKYERYRILWRYSIHEVNELFEVLDSLCGPRSELEREEIIARVERLLRFSLSYLRLPALGYRPFDEAYMSAAVERIIGTSLMLAGEESE